MEDSRRGCCFDSSFARRRVASSDNSDTKGYVGSIRGSFTRFSEYSDKGFRFAVAFLELYANREIW
jgi:hypothetical protein